MSHVSARGPGRFAPAHLLAWLLPLVCVALAPATAAQPATHVLDGPVELAWEAWATAPGFGTIDRGHAVAISPDGARVFVLASQGLYYHWTLAYDGSTGELLWDAIWMPTSCCIGEFPRDIAVSPDGSVVYTLGNDIQTTPFYSKGLALLARDAATGELLWNYHREYGGHEEPHELVVHPASGVVYATTRVSLSGCPDNMSSGLLVAVDPTGEELWTTSPVWPPEGGYPRVVDVSPDGQLLATAGIWGKSGAECFKDEANEVYVAVNDAMTGAELWIQHFEGEGDGYYGGEDAVDDIAWSPDGSRFAVCGSIDAPFTSDRFVRVYEASGGPPVWVQELDLGTFTERATALAYAPDGSALFVGGTSSGGEVPVTAHDAQTGAILWQGTYTEPFLDTCHVAQLALTPDGERVVVTGLANVRDRHWDYTTLAFATATGELVWSARYDGPGFGDGQWASQDRAEGLVISPDGERVVATGWSNNPVTSTDVLTVSYRIWPSAQHAILGTGCPGTAGLPTLTTTDLPLLGANVTIELANAPALTPVWLALSSPPVALPWGGCTLYVDPDQAVVVAGTTTAEGDAAWVVRIPFDPVLAGIPFALQAAVPDPGAVPPLSLTPGLVLVPGS